MYSGGPGPGGVYWLVDIIASVKYDAAIYRQQPGVSVTYDAFHFIEFVPGLWVLPVRTRTLPPASCTNVWMPGGRRFVVIDPGMDDEEEAARLLAVARKRRDAGSVVEAVLLTHHHRDHVTGAGAIAAALGVPVWAHDDTLTRLRPLPAGVRTRALADGESIDLDGSLADVTARVVTEAERRTIQRALSDAGGDKGRAADLLQIGYKALLGKMKDLGLDA